MNLRLSQELDGYAEQALQQLATDRERRIRVLCQRLLGWSASAGPAVENAVASIELSQAGVCTLVISCEAHPVAIAQMVHRSTGRQRPFVVCDPRRGSRPGTARSADSVGTGHEARERARGGTLCLIHARPPRDLVTLTRDLRDPGSDVQQVIVCVPPEYVVNMPLIRPAPLVIPALETREQEIPRVIDEFADEAIADLCLPTSGSGTPRERYFPEVDRDWVLAHCAHALHELAKAARRVVALRAARNPSHAAVLAEVRPVSFKRWLDRGDRPMPPAWQDLQARMKEHRALRALRDSRRAATTH